MLIIFTGNGKGKTSAALGVALRSLGWGKKVAVIQFLKGYKDTGEWRFLNKIAKLLNCQIVIKQFLDDNKLSISEKSILENPEYKKSCQKAWKFAKDIILNKKPASPAGRFDLIILDEINNALHYNLLDKNDVLSFVETHGRASEPDLILTGRNAVQELIEIADLVTEMNEIKHPFQKGIAAKKGIDF